MQNIIKIYTVAVETNVRLLRLPKHIILPPVFSAVYDALCNMLYITALFCSFTYLSFVDVWLLITPLVSI